MAVVYRCDRCHKDFKESKELRTIRIPYTDKWNRFDEEIHFYEKELCNDCWIFIIEHVKPLTKEK